ncbi:MAG: branched-chain amino acid ABC transporter permease [Candidatus Bathyarchaeota archaeon]
MALLEIQTLVNVSIMIILCMGFTFTYMMEGFPNFAHASYASIGAIVSFYFTRIMGMNPYVTWPLSVLAGGVIGVLLYVVVVRPIKRVARYHEITLTLTFLVISYVIHSVGNIFSYWSRYFMGAQTKYYNLRSYDFSWDGYRGIIVVSSITCLLLIVGIHIFLTRTKLGIGLRAASENGDLAAVLGINTDRAHMTSWFLSGGLATLAGSIMAINSGIITSRSDGLMVTVMSAAILGGLYSIYGAVIGGFLVTVTQDFLKNLFFIVFGLVAVRWQELTPIIFLLGVMILFPNGITSHRDLSIQGLLRKVLKAMDLHEN